VVITVPATTITAVSVELVTADETSPGLGKQMLSAGCAAGMMVMVVASMIGLVTIARWVTE
jgi:hypothetical protein